LPEAMAHARPFVFLRTRASGGDEGYALELESWPSGDRRTLERFDFHGAWLEWDAP
jgi:hypothetical protein